MVRLFLTLPLILGGLFILSFYQLELVRWCVSDHAVITQLVTSFEYLAAVRHCVRERSQSIQLQSGSEGAREQPIMLWLTNSFQKQTCVCYCIPDSLRLNSQIVFLSL